MKFRRRNLLVTASTTVVLSLLAHGAKAQGAKYPDRPVKIVVPAPPGGSLDTAARLIGRRFTEATGQPFVVENRPGAAGSVGARAVAVSNPDGYSLLAAFPSPITVNPHLQKGTGYTKADFASVGLISTMSMALVVPTASPIKTLADLVKLGKGTTPPFFSSAGNGALSHLSGVVFNNVAGTSFGHIPYKGGPPSAMALLAGEVAWAFLDAGNAKSLIADGRLRALAVSTRSRSPLWPAVPSMAELGYQQIDISVWFGLLAPARTPQPVVQRLNSLLLEALSDPAIQAAIRSIGNEPVLSGNTPETFDRLLQSESEAYDRAIRSAGLKVD